jgi:hypothetical protein
MASVLSCAVPPLPDLVFRRRLAVIRTRLAELETACPPGHVAGVADALEAVEAELASLGCHYPEPPLTPHDRAFLAAAGAL